MSTAIIYVILWVWFATYCSYTLSRSNTIACRCFRFVTVCDANCAKEGDTYLTGSETPLGCLTKGNGRCDAYCAANYFLNAKFYCDREYRFTSLHLDTIGQGPTLHWNSEAACVSEKVGRKTIRRQFTGNWRKLNNKIRIVRDMTRFQSNIQYRSDSDFKWRDQQWTKMFFFYCTLSLIESSVYTLLTWWFVASLSQKSFIAS